MIVRRVWIVTALLWMFATTAAAQVTTGTVRGTVKSSEDGAPMQEVYVTLRHVPSGNDKTTTTNEKGEFVFSGLRVGGPYTVTAVMDGLLPAEAKDIFLSAGKTRDVPLALRLPQEVIEVTGTSVPRNTSARTVITSTDIDN